ncbi:MAG: sigma-70 family RNA polymerase sigma factor [Ruminococcus sp.]|nr:sigma-70 family RNA polymerase sigma factor [Ruminococcus sp.]
MSLDVKEHYDKIYRYCYLRVGNRETAEDLTQETFLRYLKHPKYHNIDKTLQLLYTIAGNLCKDEYNRIKTVEIPENTVSGENIEESVITNYALSEALKKLSPEDREIILLRYVNEVSVNVIAKLYSISRFALNRRINKILAELHKELGKE